VFECSESLSLEDIGAGNIDRCGSPIAAHWFFMAFILIVSIIFLNLFIAIILEGFAKSKNESKLALAEEAIEKFKEVWTKYDKRATGMLYEECLQELLMDLIQAEIEKWE
jgi:uncharacterized membrane protein